MADEVYEGTDVAGGSADEQIIAVVRKAFDDADTFKRPIKKKWDYHFSLLQGDLRRNSPSRAWQTNRFINLIRVASTLLKSRFYQGMPIGQAQARTLEASLNQDSINNVLEYDQERAGLEREMGNVIDDGINFACGVLRQGWKVETVANIPRSESFFKKMIKAIKKLIPKFKEVDILYDGPTFDWVDPFTFRWDPNGADIDECAFVMENTDETIYQLRRDPSIDKEILKKVEAYSRNIETLQDDMKARMTALGLNETACNRAYKKIKEGLHEKCLYWGTYDLDGDGVEEECKFIIIDWMFVACKMENPFWHGKKPYSKWAFEVIPGFFVGHSLIDQAAQSQEEINDIANQAGDVRKLVLKPYITFKLGSDTEPEAVQVAPGMLIPVESQDDIEFHQPDPGVIQAIMAVQNNERAMFQLITGMNDVSLGQQDVGIGDNTATGAAIAQEQTELRYKAPAIGLDLFMERVGDMLIWNEQQFRSRKSTVPVKDRDGRVTYKEIAPKELSGLFSYRMISSSLSLQTPTMKINNLLKALQLINNNPSYNPIPIMDQILKETGVDPATVKVAQQGDMDAIGKLNAMPPDQQEAAIAKMSPEDQALVRKALINANASTTAGQDTQGQPGPQAIQGGAPLQPAAIPQPAAPMG